LIQVSAVQLRRSKRRIGGETWPAYPTKKKVLEKLQQHIQQDEIDIGEPLPTTKIHEYLLPGPIIVVTE
jgi:hypothetical protein